MITLAASAQTVLTLSDTIVSSTVLDADGKKEVATFIKATATLLRSQDASQVRKGRESIINTIGKSQANSPFRTLFTALMLPSLKEVIKTGTQLQGVNALEVMRALNSPDSLSALAEQCSLTAQPQPSLRLVASGGLATSILFTDLNTAQADAIVRTLSTCIDREIDWMVTAYELQSLKALATSPRVPKASQGTARVVESSALSTLVNKIRKKSVDAIMIRAVNRTLDAILSGQIEATDATAMADFGKSLEPALKTLIDMAKDPPSTEHAVAFAQSAKLAESLLNNLGGNRKPTKGAGGSKPATAQSGSTDVSSERFCRTVTAYAVPRCDGSAAFSLYC